MLRIFPFASVHGKVLLYSTYSLWNHMRMKEQEGLLIAWYIELNRAMRYITTLLEKMISFPA